LVENYDEFFSSQKSNNVPQEEEKFEVLLKKAETLPRFFQAKVQASSPAL